MTAAKMSSCFAAVVDWGTSNLRIWLLGESGGVLGHTASADGADGLGAKDFEKMLRMKLAALGAVWPAYAKLPVVICGMAGARNGWLEAGYVPVPAAPADCLSHAVKVEAEGIDVRILPGLSNMDEQYPDVMRGEETQLLGLAALEQDFSGLICLPGTHSKWVRFERGRILNFHTAMTGELFALLSRQSVLRHVIGERMAFTPDSPAFDAGVAEALAQPERLILNLFPVRAAGLLAGQTGEVAAARLSGLLIGAEISASIAQLPADVPVALAAAGRLTQLYAQVLRRAGRDYRLFDAEALALTGLRAAVRHIFGSAKG